MDSQKILIVDDRPPNLLALEKTLAETVTDLVRATSGEQALAATLEHEFALAILDVKMPGMDGIELAELLRGDSKTRHLPIIFLTAGAWRDDQIFRGYESGAVDYIVKPYNPTILVSKVKVFLKLHAQKLELSRQREQLAALNKDLQSFSRSVSHDLRAPVRAIKGFSDVLIKRYGGELDERGQDYLQRIRRAGDQMGEQIEGLLLLARVNRAELSRRAVDLADLARAVADDLHQSWGDRSVTFEVSGPMVVLGDVRLLRILLDNLLGNAWKFTKNCADARVEFGSTRRDGQPVYFVRDNGAGFDMNYAHKLFNVFQRLHSRAAFDGTGIGLVTVQRIVHRHEGMIWADGEVDKGATFYFTLGS